MQKRLNLHSLDNYSIYQYYFVVFSKGKRVAGACMFLMEACYQDEVSVVINNI